MHSRPVSWAALVGLVVGLGSACAAEEKPARPALAKGSLPAVVLHIASIDNLIADGRYLVAMAGKEEEGKQAEQILKALIGKNGLEGIDTTKPFGIYGQLGAKFEDASFAMLLPVAEEKTLLALLEKANLKAEKDKDGVFQVDLPRSPVPAYFRFANKYLYATIGAKVNLNKDRLLAPEAVFPSGEKATLALTVKLDEVPQSLRDLILGKASLNAAQSMEEKRKDETPAQKAFRGAVADESLAQLKVLLREGKSLRLGLDIDPQAGELSGSLVLTAKPGSTLADAIANLGQTRSLGGALMRDDAALNLVVSASLPEKLRKALEPVLDEVLAMGKKDEVAQALVKAVAPTLKMAQIDAGVHVRGPGAKGLYTVVMGLKVKEGAGIEAAARDIVKKLPREVQDAINLDAAKSDGGNIHQINQEHADAATRAVLGNNPIYFAVRDNVVLLAAGANSLDALKDALKAGPRASQVIHIEAAMSRLAQLMARDNKHAPAAAKEAFARDKNADRIQFVVEGGNALRVRGKIHGQVLRFITLIEEMKKDQ